MKSIAWLLGTTACGLLVALIAAFMAAGGHGWVAPMVSATAILTAPAGAAAALVRKRVFAIVVIVTNLAADIAFVVLTARTLDDAASTFKHLAPLVIVWAVLWLVVQVPPITVAFAPRGSRA